MARKSRKKTNENIITTNKNKYSVGVYARLSSLTDIKKDEISIENQINIALDYIKDKEELSLCEIYSDTNKTGTNFERNGFEKLLEDVKSGKINCIVVKDLSRFGRNYIDCGTYLEKIFPYIGVRFIAINDNYDSENQNSSEILMMHLKNIVNELYAKDISKKSSTALREKKKKGEFIGSFASYGYLKDSNNKNKLVVNEETAPIVKMIFDLRLNGFGYNKIANSLNKEKILSPYAYLYSIGSIKNEKFKNCKWNTDNIKKLLNNFVYTGNLVQNVHKTGFKENRKEYRTKKEDWIIVQNTHQAIIDEETFYEVQKINEKAKEDYKNKNKFNKNKTENIFKGVIKCGCCGKNLIRRERSKKIKNGISIYRFFECNYVKLKQCHLNGKIKESILKQIVFEEIQKQIQIAKIFDDLIYKNQQNIALEKNKIKKLLENINVEINEIQDFYKTIYEDYTLKILTQQEYNFIKNEYINKEKELKNKRQTIEKNLVCLNENFNNENKFIKNFLKFKNSKVLTSKLIQLLIKEIVIYDDFVVKITFNYTDEYNILSNKFERVEKNVV